MPEQEKVYGNRWHVVREIGKGGQGVVYEVVEGPRFNVSEQVKKVQTALRQSVAIMGTEDQWVATADLINSLRPLVAPDERPKGALKELLPIDKAVDAHTALERMQTELHVLKSMSHSSLIKVLDDQLEERWFVTEYFKNGTLGGHLDRHKGRVLDALRAFLPIVDAVAELHKAGIVHRDIKPENVFIADDGHLVLGDCGLAIKLEHQERLTVTFENVGTRDYQPPWSYGMRLEDVKPNFDVFSLGKLLWAMVSGQPKCPLWYFDRPQHDIRKMFPERSEMSFVRRILVKCVVQEEEECKIPDATALRNEIDEMIRALESGGQVPSRRQRMLCRFCGIGHYEHQAQFRNEGFFDIEDRRYYYRCDNCGHLESFFFRKDKLPPGWEPEPK